MSNKDQNAVNRLEQRTRPVQFRRTLMLATMIAGATLIAGCDTLDSTGHRVLDPVRTEKVAKVLETTITSGVLVGIQKQPRVAGYFQAVGSAACSFSDGTDLSPAALNAALQATTIREFKTIEAQLMVNSMVMAYTLAYADRARADVEANVYAKTIVDVLCKGVHNGVEQAKAQGLIRAAR